MNFKKFKTEVDAAIKAVLDHNDDVFVVDLGRDSLWDAYLQSFPEDNGERQSYNCNACKAFIRNYGGIVTIDKNTYQIVTFWDSVHNEEFSNTVKALSKMVKSAPIRNIFIQNSYEFHGCDHNIQRLVSGETITWEHLFVKVPNKFIKDYSPRVTSEALSSKTVLMNSLIMINNSAVETVLDLIEDNSLYRGAEYQKSIEMFKTLQEKANKVHNLDNFCWFNYKSPASRIKNTAIGTLLLDLSEGKDLESAVRSYEFIMAPSNYKRPKALITKKQIEAAQKTVEDLGLTDSLPRRHACVEDISVNDVLFVNRDTKVKMKDNPFDILSKDQVVNSKNYNNVSEITADEFLKDILPNKSKIEVLFDNNKISNLVTLTAPVNKDAKPLFKWNNNFAWAYNGSVSDSFKEKIKLAGGNVDGFLRCSLHWFNYDDLDIHVMEPTGEEIYYRHKHGSTGGVLDVDMNAGGGHTRDAVENIIWSNLSSFKSGNYDLYINQFRKRESIDFGFEVEIEVNGELFQFKYDQPVNGNVKVATIEVDSNKNIKVIPRLNSSTTSRSKNIWGLDTMKFHEVSCIMLSPNYWEGNAIGNKHYFFMLKDCKNPDPVRGFFNEYLRSDLEKDHKRVFEALASRAKIEYNDSQLSGLGFSTTTHGELTVKVDNKPYKIIF